MAISCFEDYSNNLLWLCGRLNQRKRQRLWLRQNYRQGFQVSNCRRTSSLIKLRYASISLFHGLCRLFSTPVFIDFGIFRAMFSTILSKFAWQVFLAFQSFEIELRPRRWSLAAFQRWRPLPCIYIVRCDKFSRGCNIVILRLTWIFKSVMLGVISSDDTSRQTYLSCGRQFFDKLSLVCKSYSEASLIWTR